MASAFDILFSAPATVSVQRKKRSTFGENNNRHKLTEEQVRKIFDDPRKPEVIGKDYNVSTETIYSIKNGYTWKHLKLKSK